MGVPTAKPVATWAEAVASLAEVLRAAGIQVSVQHGLHAARVLEELDARGQLRFDAEYLAGFLAPIFCTHPRHQERFPDLLQAWLRILGLVPDEVAEPVSDPVDPSEDPRSERRKQGGGGPGWRWMTPRRAASVLVGVVLFGVVAWWYLARGGRGGGEVDWTGQVLAEAPDGVVAGAEIHWAGMSTRSDASGRFGFRARSPQPGELTVIAEGYESAKRSGTNLVWPLVVRLRAISGPRADPDGPPPPPPPEPGEPIVIRPAAFETDGAPLEWELAPPTAHRTSAWFWPWLAPLAWLGFVAWRERRREAAVFERRMSEEPGQVGSFRVPTASRLGLAGVPARELARDLRRRRLAGTGQLDVVRTLEAAVRRPGQYLPVFGAWVESEYLVLVDRGSPRDHQAQWVEEALKALRESGVGMEVLHFDGDPTWCFPPPVPGRVALESRVRLEELAVRFSDHRLLLFTAGGGFFDGYTGRPAAWVRTVEAWPERAWVTPNPVSRWGRREWLVERLGLAVLPMTREGFRLLGDLFRDRPPSRLAPPGSAGEEARLFATAEWRWMERLDPAEETVDELYWSLVWEFGPAGMRWLAACAVYPELHWGLTLQLGERLIPDLAAREPILARLVRLVWFRAGTMPDWLRRTLLARLPTPERDRLQTEVMGVLERAGVDVPRSPRAATEKGKAEVALPRNPTAPGSPKSAWWSSGLRAMARWLKGRHRALRREELPPDSPLRDWVYLRFISGERLDILTPTVPERLRRALFPEGQARLGPRWQALGMIVALFLGVLTYLGYPPWERRNPGACLAVAVAGTNDVVAALYVDGSVAVWPALDPGDPAGSRGHWLKVDAPVRAIAMADTETGPVLGLGGRDGQVVVGPAGWTGTWGLAASTNQGIRSDVTALVVLGAAETNWVAVGHADGTLSAGHAANAATVTGYNRSGYGRVNAGSTLPIRAVLLDADSEDLGVLDGGGEIAGLSLSFEEVRSEPWPTNEFELLAQAPSYWRMSYSTNDPMQLALGGRDGAVTVLEEGDALGLSAQPRFVLDRHGAAILAVSHAPGGLRLASAGLDGQVLLWEGGEAGNEYRRVSRMARPDGTGRYYWSLAFSRDGRRLLASGSDGAVRVFRVPPAPRSARPAVAADVPETGADGTSSNVRPDVEQTGSGPTAK